MFKFAVFCTLLAITTAKPGLIHGIAAPAHVVGPSGVSHQSRHDIIHPGVITATSVHTIPVVHAVHIATAPAVRVASAATSHLDVRGHSGLGLGAGAGLGAGITNGGTGLGLGGGLGLGSHGY